MFRVTLEVWTVDMNENLETPVSITQYNSAAPQATPSKMTVKLNQSTSKN